MIIEVNWNNFKAKFNNQEEVAFERFCYLLFCKEFNKNTGVFRFKNHAGIETDPVEQGDLVVGWQAKFYSTALSQHAADFKESIDIAKERHPQVNKIIFYTNQEFGQDKKKTDPQYKKDIETHAKSKGIEIEWRTGSYFEAPFVCEENSSIAQHFFSLETGIIDSIVELQKYTDSVLPPIRSEIPFGENVIKLDRCFQHRWMGENGKRRKKPVKKYTNKMEVELVLRPYQKKLYAFISPADRSDYVLCDKINIALVRLVQKGNIFAREKFAELVQYIINDWTERNQRLCRWKGYVADIETHLERCIRRFRYAGTFLGYLFRTLECAGRGLRPLYDYSLDETFSDGDKRKGDNLSKNYETGEVRYFRSKR